MAESELYRDSDSQFAVFFPDNPDVIDIKTESLGSAKLFFCKSVGGYHFVLRYVNGREPPEMTDAVVQSALDEIIARLYHGDQCAGPLSVEVELVAQRGSMKGRGYELLAAGGCFVRADLFVAVNMTYVVGTCASKKGFTSEDSIFLYSFRHWPVP